MATQVEGLLLEIKAKVDGFDAKIKQAGRDIDQLGDKSEQASNRMTAAFKRAGAAVATYLSAQALAGFTKGLFNAAMEMERLELKMLAATGTARESEKALAFVRGEAERLGVGFVELADGFASFSASALQGGMSMQEVQKAFIGVTEASVALGLSQDRIALVFRAMEQMASKPTIALEELKLQLGDQLPGVIGIAAQKIGVDVGTLMKSITDGSVNSIPFINALGEALSEKFGKSATQASESARAAMGRLNTAIFDLKVTLADGQFMDTATNAVDRFTQAVKNPAIQNGLNIIVDALAKITEILIVGIAYWIDWGAGVYNATMQFLGFKDATDQVTESQIRLKKAIAATAAEYDADTDTFTITSPNRNPVITPKAAKSSSGGGGSGGGNSREQAMQAMRDRIDALTMTLASETEQEQLAYENRLELLREALEMRVITQAEYDELEVQAAADKAARIAEIEQKAADDRLKQEETVQDMIVSLKKDAINNALNLMGVLGRKNKAFAIAQVALSKAQAMAEAIHKTHLAAAAALVTDPTGATTARVTAIGYANVAAIAATGLAEIASMGGGGSGAGGGTTTITNPNAEGSQQQVATRKANVYIDMRGDDDAMLSRNRVRKLLEQINEAMGDGSMLVVAA